MKVFIDYMDGQYLMYSCEAGGLREGWKPNAEIDDRDWERYQEFQRASFGWDCYIRDLNEKVAIGPPWRSRQK